MRDARRQEVESDLWESAHDRDLAGALPLHIVARLMAGVVDDLGWGLEQWGERHQPARRVAFVCGAAAILALFIGMAIAGMRQPQMPDLPELTRSQRVMLRRPPLPPPPPPPPPPCARKDLPWGQTNCTR